MTENSPDFEQDPTDEEIRLAVQERSDLCLPVGQIAREKLFERTRKRFRNAVECGDHGLYGSSPKELIKQIVDDLVKKRSASMAVGARRSRRKKKD